MNNLEGLTLDEMEEWVASSRHIGYAGLRIVQCGMSLKVDRRNQVHAAVWMTIHMNNLERLTLDEMEE